MSEPSPHLPTPTSYEDFILQLLGAGGQPQAAVLQSPAGEAESTVFLTDRWIPAPELNATATTNRNWWANRSGSRPGSELFSGIFRDTIRARLAASRGRTAGVFDPDQKGLRINLLVMPGDKDSRCLAALPWELMHDPETGEDLALASDLSIVRYVGVGVPPCRPRRGSVLRILMITAQPAKTPRLDLDREVKTLQELSSRFSPVRVEHIARCSPQILINALRREPFDVLHYAGHGTYDPSYGEACLQLEGFEGRREPLGASLLTKAMRRGHRPGLVFLNSCEGGVTAPLSHGAFFSEMATALIRVGIPAVVAHQSAISDLSAHAFMCAFYTKFLSDDQGPIDGAVAEGRFAISTLNRRDAEWAVPVLFLRAPDGRIFEPRTEHKAAPEAAAATPAGGAGSPAGIENSFRAGSLEAESVEMIGTTGLAAGSPSRPIRQDINVQEQARVKTVRIVGESASED